MQKYEVDAGYGIEWRLLNDYTKLWEAENPGKFVPLDSAFYNGFDTWLSNTYKTINNPSQEMVFRFACIEDKVEFLLRCK